MRETHADLLLLSVTFFWGITFLMVQEALDTIGVLAFLFWRFFIALLVMLVISKSAFKYLNKETFTKGIMLGVFLFLAFAFQTFALLYAQSSIVAFLTGLSVIMVPILLFLFFKSSVRGFVFIGSLIAMVGLYLLTMSGELTFGVGEFLTLICTFFVSIHIIYTDRYSKRYNIRLLVLLQFLVIVVLSLAGALTFEGSVLKMEWLNFEVLIAVGFTSILCTVYGFLVQTSVQRYTTPSKTAIIFTTEPIFAFAYGYLVGNEIFTTAQMWGCVLIVMAMLVAELKWSKFVIKPLKFD